MLNQWSYAFFMGFLAKVHLIVDFARSEVARITEGNLPAELCVVTFLGCAVNVQNRLAFYINERGCFERLEVVVRRAAVVFATWSKIVASIAA